MKELTFLDLYLKYISYHKKTVDHFDKRKSGTINCYVVKHRLLKEFLSEQDALKISPYDFNIKLVKKFFEWLREEKNHSHNYAARVTGLCRIVLQFGAERELINNNPLAYYKTKRVPPKEPPYFTPEQITLFENYKSTSTMKQKAADMFVVQLHTGFDFSDLADISEKHITVLKDGTKYIIKPRCKNGQDQIIPLSEKLEAILQKHNYKLGLLSNPVYNRTIKMIAKDLRINVYLTAKAGRKLFFMCKLNHEGYSIQAVSKMGGHRSVQTTEQYYARVDISLIHNEFLKRAV